MIAALLADSAWPFAAALARHDPAAALCSSSWVGLNRLAEFGAEFEPQLGTNVSKRFGPPGPSGPGLRRARAKTLPTTPVFQQLRRSGRGGPQRSAASPGVRGFRSRGFSRAVWAAGVGGLRGFRAGRQGQRGFLPVGPRGHRGCAACSATVGGRRPPANAPVGSEALPPVPCLEGRQLLVQALLAAGSGRGPVELRAAGV